MERLQREIAILSRIDHPAVAQVLDADPTENPPWLVTPLGVPLDKWWADFCETASIDERFEIARSFVLELADGLRVVHEHGIVHRDLKPENVILLGEPRALRPVLIDFGVAYVPAEPRLTELDRRAVRNRFMSHPQAYYEPLENPPPWWDCLGLAWIWGWMISTVDLDKRFRFHWKYHPLIQHRDSANVRALLAACSSESVGPVNGGQFIALMTRLGLGNETMAQDDFDSSTFAEAARAAATAEAEHLARAAARVEAVESGAAVLGTIYDDVCSSLERMALASGLPLRVERPWNEPAGASLVRLGDDDESVITLLEIEGTRPSGNFRVLLSAAYRPLPLQFEALPFVFTLQSENTFAIGNNSIVHRRDGVALLYGPLSPTPPDTFAQRLQHLIIQPVVWNPEPIF
jgi:hypothetical protein